MFIPILLAVVFLLLARFSSIYVFLILIAIVIALIVLAYWVFTNSSTPYESPPQNENNFSEEHKARRDITRTFVLENIPQEYLGNATILLDSISYNTHPEKFNQHVNLTRSELLKLLAIFFHHDKYTSFLSKSSLTTEEKENIRSNLEDINKILINITQNTSLHN